MKKKSFKLVSSILAFTMVIGTVMTGCGKKEPVEEDVVTTINISSEDLAPEITDEDLGIVRKDVSELMTITGYQSWEGYNFLVITPNASSNESITVQIEDEDLFHSLYQARLHVYVEPSYSSVGQDDPMYAAYAKGLRSLGDEFYNMSNGETVTAEDQEEPNKEETDNENTTNETTDEVDELLGEGEDTVTDTEASDSAESESEDNQEDVSVNDVAEGDVQDLESLLNGGWADTEAAKAEKKAQEDLNNAIKEYMQSISLNRATQILIYSLDGELLGDMTPAKLDDYVAAFDNAPKEYETIDGVVYVSDLKDGVEYEIPGYVSDDLGNCEYMIKNDSKRPVTLYLHSETSEKEEVIFQNYMPTGQSTGWYLVENQYGFTSTDPTYVLRVEHMNSDADLAASLHESNVLIIDKLDEKPVTVNSTYSAIVNNTDYSVYIQADTGDSYILDSKQAIGVHKSAYSSLTYEFEGAGATE